MPYIIKTYERIGSVIGIGEETNDAKRAVHRALPISTMFVMVTILSIISVDK
jgi:amino acid transporter